MRFERLRQAGKRSWHPLARTCIMTFFTHADFCLRLAIRKRLNCFDQLAERRASRQLLHLLAWSTRIRDWDTSRASGHSLRVELASSLVSLLRSLLGSPLLTSAVVVLVGSSDSGSAMGAECLIVGGDSGKLVLTLSSASWHDRSGGLVVGGGRLALVGG